ncbi:DnaD domain protein [Virgibacillus pantothenticus]|uniref:DnaD domain-containing protein n=1 Tax=Virgibacillus pantothenticus TaxID=1473 RepID=UPI002E24A077|nr:DnaD domain protein [Virgibacillus pantothenticus]MED3738806.1 DnaD domain protein [Virgibacillus pantothenticus]
MAKFRMVHTEFWNDPRVVEEMTPEDKYFFLYLLTNANTTQIGIYQITKKQMAFDTGHSIESINALLDRFINHHKIINYDPATRELAIKNWGKYNFLRGGKPMLDCVTKELKEVKNKDLIPIVGERVEKPEIKALYDTYTLRTTIRGQEEEQEEEKEEEKEQQQEKDVSVIIQFWDDNGFGFNNMHAKQQLLSWLDDSNFKNPSEMILKALGIAAEMNKRRLNYVEGILKNWQNESLLTAEEVDQREANRNKSEPSNNYDPSKDRF